MIAMVEYEDCIVFNLAKAYQTAHGALAALLRPNGLTPIQALVLEATAQDEGQSAGEIGRRLVLDNATLSGVLERLAEGGWIDKRTDENDRRVLRIDLTEQARTFRSTLLELRGRANEEILSSLSREEQILLKRLLREVR
jgi:DNA-binding MarR family transcriptional regulator